MDMQGDRDGALALGRKGQAVVITGCYRLVDLDLLFWLFRVLCAGSEGRVVSDHEEAGGDDSCIHDKGVFQ